MHDSLAVVPVLVGPMQVLLAILPGILMALGGTLVYLLKPSTMKVGLQLLWRVKVTVVLVTAVVAGSVTLAGAVLPQRQTSVSEAEASAHDWPQFRGGLARRGALPGAAGPVQGGINWTFNQPADTFYSSPTVVGNRVYVASATGLSVFNKQGVGEIFCLDADTGGLVWRGGPSDYRATFSSPSVVGNRLAIGEGLHQARDARVVVLDLDRDGEVLWTYRTNSHAESSPVIHDGRVYSGSGRDGWYCFELEPDADGNAQVVWHVPGDRYPDASGSASVHDGVVYVPMGRWGGTGVAALDADTGDELWRIDTAHAVFSGPTIAEQANLLFVGMGTGNFIQTAEQAITAELNYLREQGATEAEVEAARPRFGPGGAVWAIDLDTHDVQWRFDTERAVLGQVAAADDRIYFGSRDGHLYSVSFAGDLLGKWNAHAPIIASPAVTDDHVYIVTENGRLYGLTRDTLRPVWEFTLADTGRFLSSPAVARGQVYVGTEGAGLLAVGSPASDDRDADTPHWPGHLAGPGQPGSLAAGPLPGRGGLLWRYPDPDDDNETPAPHISA
ncbi:MAG: PQQ-binding-like beta-propeller repeat protein, partial [Phycisphaeraceae bacterium]